jgi:hypothetical protein
LKEIEVIQDLGHTLIKAMEKSELKLFKEHAAFLDAHKAAGAVISNIMTSAGSAENSGTT